MTEFLKSNSAPIIIKPQEEPSNIQRFYSGSSIFITGASGFLGQLLLEKLLRSCPDLTQVYLLMREKKGKSIKERLDTMFNDVVYDRLRLEQPKFSEKVSIMSGDCELTNMGLSDNDLDLIRSNVDIIFHVAATVRFTEHLRKAVAINVMCTKDLLCLAKTMLKLKAFVYVSTAYSNCVHAEVKEEFYEVPVTCDKLIDICDALDDSQLETLTPQFLGKWPNTYSYTKSVAENAVRTYGQMLPVTIVRPSIVVATAKEPVTGWVTNIVSATGVFLGVAVGILRVMPGDANNVADIVPADYCINSVIAAAWQVGTAITDQQNAQIPYDADNFKDIVSNENIPIYNYVSSPENPINWGRFRDIILEHADKMHTVKAIWMPILLYIPNRFLYLLYIVFLHYLPAVIVDGASICMGKKPVLIKTYKKVHALTDSLHYFTSRTWNFQNKNTQALWKTLSERDRQLFEFNITPLDWRTYIWDLAIGLRIYILKDPLDMIPQGLSRVFKFKIAHYTIVCLLVFALIKFAIVVLRHLLSALY